ncbi:MAG: DEAD/DEAH box helicase, partial [Verrucomicrobiaceae bacterium]
HEVEQAVAEGRDFVDHEGQRLPATQETLAALDSLLNTPKKLPKDPTTTFALLIEGNYEEVGCGTSLTTRASLSSAAVPTCLRTALKDHQIHGLRWLQDAWHQGMPGLLLADDMGLGKTLQALTFLAWLRENTRLDPGPNEGGILIVAPTALLRNWKAEAEKHLEEPGLGEVLEIHGSSLRRVRHPSGQGLNVDLLRQADCLLTTYETLQGYQTDFGSIRFRCLVLDEAQKVKSPDTQVTSAIKAVNADFKIAMTGTPVENRRADLWCVSDTVYPGLLGSLKEFSQAYEKDESHEAAAKLHGLITKADGNDRTPQPFMLRRMKQDILDGLPPKNSFTLLEDMPSLQAQRYRGILDSSRGTAPGGKLMAIQALRTVSLHPWLADGDHQAAMEFDTEHFIASSARIKSLVKILQSIQAAGEKALLFVNSRSMQQWLRVFVADIYGLTDVALINGNTPGAQRQAAVDRFQNLPPGFGLMLLSPRAAGVGLTITAANHVIHLERWWNPAVEDQCTDRVYRIGQDKPVTIWLPQAVHPAEGIRQHSFDLRIHDLLENKRRLSRDLLAPVENSDKDTAQLFHEIVDSAA